jgi:hypothetical protein
MPTLEDMDVWKMIDRATKIPTKLLDAHVDVKPDFGNIKPVSIPYLMKSLQRTTECFRTQYHKERRLSYLNMAI